MQSLSHSSRHRFILVRFPQVRLYNISHTSFQPASPTAQLKSSTHKPAKTSHKWTEANATVSEADVKADRAAIAKELHSAKVQREIAAFGETGWKKAYWAD